MMDAGGAVLTLWTIIAAILLASWTARIEVRRNARRPKKNNAAGVGPTARSTDGSSRPNSTSDWGKV